MRPLTPEDILRQLCDDCGFDLLRFRHTADRISLDVASQRTGMPALVGVGVVGGPCILSDDNLDKLEARLLELPTVWTLGNGEGRE